MKAFSHQRSARVPPSETLPPHKHRQPRIPKENVDPGPAPPESSLCRSPFVAGKPLVSKNRSPLHPRPPLSSNHGGNRLKRKLNLETLPENGVPASMASDSGVQVIVRMRPLNKDEEGELIVQKISPNSVSILDHTFTFDSVADSRSTQEDIFHLVGIPLVENCLAGFNSSIFAYGQTGSGKTYTMWGPPSAFSEDASASGERGLTPRVFERLFSRIDEEQAKHTDKQLNYQCRCSFLEIYNEQITDLLDPTQRNLQIREDVRTGVYVDCLTEEYVCTMNDVIQLLTKGLANRRIGATSINAESSRSHCVFTCVIESRSKSVADGLSSLRTSRINLVDLAGSERQKQTGAAGERLKEAGNINRSLSQLGNLINILAEVSQSGKQRHIPYRDSRLTFLLQESLGGNAKLAVLCAISPSQSCKSETFSTLRFAQRAKAIKNKAVVNEVMQDDVNVLREQIRLLKDELLRMKSHGTQLENNGSYSTGWNARRSLNLLRMSLNRPRVLLPVIKDDSDEEMEIDENDVEKPHIGLGLQPSCDDKVPAELEISEEAVRSCISDNKMILRDAQSVYISGSGGGTNQANAVEGCELKDIDQGHIGLKSVGKEHCSTEYGVDKPLNGTCTGEMHDETQVLSDNVILSESKPLEEKALLFVADRLQISSSTQSIISPSKLSIVPCQTSPVLQSPALSTSPVVENHSRKSLRTSSSKSASQKNKLENDKSHSGALNVSFADNSSHNSLNASFMETCKKFPAPTEHLVASLRHGLQIIDNHQCSSALRRSSFKFSIRPIDVKPMRPVSKVDAGVQTLVQESEIPEIFSTFICNHYKNGASTDEYNNGSDLQLVPIDRAMSSDKQKIQVPKAVEKVLVGAIRREMAVADQCAKQAAEIAQLNRLVQQYKHERECSAIIAQTREDKISRLESLMDGILPTEDFMEEEFVSLVNEQKLLKEKCENHPEVLRVNIELKRVQDELDRYRNFCDMGERDVLMEEIQDLRGQLQYYMSSSMSTQKPNPLPQLAHPIEPNSAPLSTISELAEENADEKLKQERCHWGKADSKWVAISEELRLELEASRSLAEKLNWELDSEKKCTEELKEALQTAMQGHAHILEQYAELQEKHIALLGRHRQISDGIEDVKRAATKAGVKGTESKFIDSLAAEISALRAEREKERRYWRDENKGLQAQLRDTAEALHAAGEVLVRLKEAEETAAIAQKRVLLAEQETEKAYQELDNLKRTYDREILLLNQFLAKSCSPKEAPGAAEFDDPAAAKYDGGGTLTNQQWTQEFESLCHEGDNEFSKGTDPNSWFSGYDRCNI